MGPRGPEAAAEQAAAPQPREELAGCALGRHAERGFSADMSARWNGGSFVPSRSLAPSAHAAASARAVRPPSSGAQKPFQSVPGSQHSAIARWRTERSQCLGLKRSAPPRSGRVRGAAHCGPWLPAGRRNLSWRRGGLSGSQRLAGPRGWLMGSRTEGGSSRGPHCVPRGALGVR